MTPAPVAPSASVPSAAKAAPSKTNLKKTTPSSRAFWMGLGVSVAWVGTVLAVIAKAGPARDFAGVPLADWAVGVSAAISPVAMVWMVTAYLQRAADIQSIADPLRRQLTLITGESGAADARIRRFNQAIREQIELLRSAQSISQDDLEAIMERVRTHRAELERFESVSTQQVKDIQDVIRRSMLQVEHMMDDKFTMLRVLDGKLQQNGDGVARQVEGMRDQVARLLEEVEQAGAQMADALDRAMRDSKKLTDTSRLQESSLTNAAAVASETLGGLSSKIDLSVTRFLERASMAREEAERLANALDAQTRALDDFSSTLPSRVSEAEAVLRGVADRLYASEQMAREQAVHLSEKLSQQVDGLQSFMDRFTSRLYEIDAGLDRRHSDLNGLADRIGSTTGSFVASWEKSVNDLNDRTGNALLRFTVVNDETRRNADSVAKHLEETTGKYEDVVLKMRALSEQSGEQVKGLTEEITQQLAQFEALSKASTSAGEEVQERANAALQNLQHVLERVLTARDATQAVGETLVKDIYAAVDQNEKMIARLNETAQLGARTITSASEQLGRQHDDLVSRARAGEATLVETAQKLQQQAEAASTTLRQQTAGLMGLLAETQSQIAATDHKMQGFATQAVVPVQKAVQQIDSSAEQGLRTLAGYGENLGQQVARLQEFHVRIGAMGEEMGKTTAQTAGTFEQLLERFSAVRTAQDDSVRQTLAQFTDLSERLQREIGGLDGEALRAVDALQQAALKVGEQSYQMLENARSSGAQIKEVTAALQAESTQIQDILRRQTDDIGADLARAEQKFAALGETIRERADAAYALIDRTTAHYGAVTQATAEELDARAAHIDRTVALAQTRIEQLQAALTQQAGQIDGEAAKIETHAGAIADTTGRAVQNLSVLNDKLAVTHESAVAESQQTLARIDANIGAFERQTRTIVESAETASGAVTKASGVFGEQAGKLIDSSHQIDGVMRQLTAATSALADQSAQIRVGMEQQNTRLLTQLADAVAQMDVTGDKLQQITVVATQSADTASARFADMTETASQRIAATTTDLAAAAQRSETMLAALGANITQQAASLSVVGEQIGEQQKLLASANESQRAQMIELFDKLRGAHTQAAEVAERSIAHLNISLQEIYRQIGLVGDRSQEAIGNVKLASVDFSEQSGILVQNAQAAEQQARAVLSVTSALQEQARNLRESLQGESERAAETLGVLLSRLTAGGVEVRDLGASTGAILSGLQRALADQSGELGVSMQQISDRQRTLTAALDAQRDVINGLLSRLTLAQDETAATAERAAIRLTDGAQQIARHAETIEARAQSALANVTAATAGFAQSAETIDTHARQAEQQTRTLAVTASGLGEQVQTMRAALQVDSERANAVLGTLLDKVTTGAAEIRDVGSSTEMVLSSLGNAVTQQSATLSSAAQQITDRQRALTVSLDAQRDVVNGLLNRLTLAQDETAATAERAAERIDDSARRVTGQMESIGAQTAATLSSVEGSITGFVAQSDALAAQSRQAEEQIRGLLSLTSGMQEQARHLREAMQVESASIIEQINAVITQLDVTGRSFSDSTEGAAQKLNALTQQFAVATQAGAESMRQQGESLSQAAEQSEARLTTAGEKIRSHIRLVGEAGDQAETQARQLADAAEFATTRVVALRDTLATVGKDGSNVVDVACQSLGTIKQSLQDELQRLSDMSRDAATRVAEATAGLATQSDILRANLSGSESALVDAAASVREEASHLPGVLGRSVGEIEAATRALKAQTEAADQSLIGVADRFISVTASARNNMADEMQRVGKIADDAGKALAGFGQILAGQIAAMQQGAVMLSGEQKELVEKTAASLDALASASDRLATLRTQAADTADRLLREFDLLDQRATLGGNRLAQAGENVVKQTAAITEATARAENQISIAGNGFREQLERIGTGMQGQIDDINRGLMQITAQLERTGSTLRSTTVGAVADVERVGQRFDQTSGEAMAQIDARTRKMQAATEEVGKLLDGFDAQMQAMLSRMA
ncbi:MAG: hypothetical protein KGI37_09445, partial [Alphaproteobacteria bacterium]|nr:hypothetical protein [Alphaproteobacteria bacterium]